ncbi:MAG TPA: CoB--CoM heterodisulfide reductase iron-sulfur subunit B family protein [Thermoleophilia bacterium]|nr:heterodisulfide reductase subunit B [Actinomycetota bacterium]HOU29140.1 CoB--CoM heterodisulfide reductase iron-sulfur subunit B family protein [Thermoleophilia bacterium]HQF52499.1 CoB--CoM heterodisulfide reductase iron-sulfur subunit B family protein [Thermoleophilia bacterium]HQH20788.1 CoB--CoM heterodisulfide reductase iron-sulfur subunit B family protein [Thermoleophilia bacterium]HQJ26202.1 CoB--CoM heterodisulfide reductase iron-sulfur subunit B family protein [Thermoleophilia bact
MSTVVDATATQDAAARQPAEVLAYYPGCSLHGTEPEYDESLRAVVEALGVAIAEIPDWNCCGASSGHTTDQLLGVALPARNLALAEAAGFDRVLTPCAACYNRLAAARLAVAEDAALAEQMPDILGRPFENSVEVLGVLSLLREAAADIADLAAAPRPTPNPMVGAKLAAYYGCLLVRPPEVSAGDDPEQPMYMDEIIQACGAEAVDWNMKVECCGGAFSVSRTSSVLRLGRAIVEDARRSGAEAIVVACPLCHTNLDLRQRAMESRGEPRIPVLFITQIVGLALGLEPEALGLKRHFIDTEPLLSDLRVRAAQRVADEKRAAEEKAAKAAARAAKAAEAKAAQAADKTGADAPADAGGDA